MIADRRAKEMRTLKLSDWKKIRRGYKNYSQADLNGANLSRADLRGADLRGAILRWADLNGANLNGADLREADLSGADLSGAILGRADLNEANLRGANLPHYYISGGFRNDSALFVPSLGKIWAGCWAGTALEFYRRCKTKTPEHRLYITTLKNILHYLSRKRRAE